MRYSFNLLVTIMFLVSAVNADITFLKIYETEDDWAEPLDVIEIASGGYVCMTNAFYWTFLRTDEYGEVLVQNN